MPFDLAQVLEPGRQVLARQRAGSHRGAEHQEDDEEKWKSAADGGRVPTASSTSASSFTVWSPAGRPSVAICGEAHQMVTDDRIHRVREADLQDVLLAGTLELDPTDGAARLSEVIDRMSEDGHSASALDLMALQVARLLVTDGRVEGLLQEAR